MLFRSILVSKNEELQKVTSEFESTKKNVVEKQKQITTLEQEVKELTKKVPTPPPVVETKKVIEKKISSPKKINTKNTSPQITVVTNVKEKLTEEIDDF